MNTNFRENINELNENLTAFPEVRDIFSEKQPWLKTHFLPLMSIDLAELHPDWKGTKLFMLNPIEPDESLIGEYTKPFHNEFVGANFLAFRLDENGKYEFLTEEGYFLRSQMYDQNRKEMMTQDWDIQYFENNPELFERRKQEAYEDALRNFDEAIETYFQNKKDYQKQGYFGGEKDYVPYYGGRFLDSLGGEIQAGNWVYAEKIPPAFELTEDEDWNVSIAYKGNPLYQIASVSGYTYSHGADAIIMLYEPVSRIVLFTFDYS